MSPILEFFTLKMMKTLFKHYFKFFYDLPIRFVRRYVLSPIRFVADTFLSRYVLSQKFYVSEMFCVRYVLGRYV
jgi:hypothetical protein